MDFLAIVRYLAPSFVIVISFFFAMRCLFAHEMRLEAWRSPLKYVLYIDRVKFKYLTKIAGWISYFIFLGATYYQIVELLDR